MIKPVVKLILAGIVQLAVLGATHDAEAADCKDGGQVSLSGIVKGSSVNEKGNLVFDVEEPSPCHIDAVFVRLPEPPKSCIDGARFVASGEVEYMFNLYLHANTITCQ